MKSGRRRRRLRTVVTDREEEFGEPGFSVCAVERRGDEIGCIHVGLAPHDPDDPQICHTGVRPWKPVTWTNGSNSKARQFRCRTRFPARLKKQETGSKLGRLTNLSNREYQVGHCFEANRSGATGGEFSWY